MMRFSIVKTGEELMKRATAVLLSIVIMLSMITVPSPVLAAGYISICGKQQTLEISPVISDNITYYPVCEIAKKLGMSVEEKDSKIVISVNNHWAEFTQQSETAVMDMVTISVKSLFRKNNDIMVEESFFTNYMKYMGFECTIEEMLTFPSIPEITAPEEVESEDTFYRNLDKVGTIIDSSQLFYRNNNRRRQSGYKSCCFERKRGRGLYQSIKNNNKFRTYSGL